MKMLADLDRQRADLQAQLLRIGGAIQVLEELVHDQSMHQPAEPIPQESHSN